MTATCETTRSLLPEWVRRELEASEAGLIDAHLATCDDCSAESQLVQVLFAGRAVPPSGLAHSVREHIASRTRRGRQQRPWWGLAAAAVAAVALGIGVVAQADPTAVVPIYATESGSADAWMSDDGEIAGAPALDDLSEDELAALLDELTPAVSGGSA